MEKILPGKGQNATGALNSKHHISLQNFNFLFFPSHYNK